MAFIRQEQGGVLYHTSSLLAETEQVVHGFTTRVGGVSEGIFSSLNLRCHSAPPDDPKRVAENYRRLCGALSLDPEGLVLSRQVHEDTVYPVTAQDSGKGFSRPRDYTADALITNQPNLHLMVFSADCGIFLLHDPVSRCIGAVHAGWRGTALDLPAKAVREMGRLYGAKPESIRVAVGASIGECCFETHDDVPNAMLAAFGQEVLEFCVRTGEKWAVDLRGINIGRLRRAGVQSIDTLPLCTGCHPELYWSHRKLGNARGVQGAVISLRGDCP